MKLLLKKLARHFGFSVSRISKQPPRSAPEACLPQSTFENVALVMDYFVNCRPDSVFVQVGACDGVTSDSVYRFVKTGVLRSILIEPIQENFSKLRTTYAGAKNVMLVNAAVAAADGQVQIYSVRDSGRWKDNKWATQLASFDRSHLVRHGIDEAEIAENTVESLTLRTVIQRNGVRAIDILQIDTEGFDHEIVRMALELDPLPACICFENCQFLRTLSQAKVDELYSRLAEKGYAWSHDRINTMAIHSRWIEKSVPEKRTDDVAKRP
jgi:FkbM family methyltransferase